MKIVNCIIVFLYVFLLTACDKVLQKNSIDETTVIKIESNNEECKTSSSKIKSGFVKFNVKNTGDKVTEFYIIQENDGRIVSEIENIGPGLSRDLILNAKPGKYYTLCKPGLIGDGVGKNLFIVVDSGSNVSRKDDHNMHQESVNNYKIYINNQFEKLIKKTEQFVDNYKKGNFAIAKMQYVEARIYYESIEIIAEMFEELDFRLDARAREVSEGQQWTGWHAIEKDLWSATEKERRSQKDRCNLSDQLLEDIKILHDKSNNIHDLSIDTLTNGAISLLEEVASNKITGEEEEYSHTDLSDLKGNIDGAQALYESVKPIIQSKDKSFAGELDAAFLKLNKNIDQYKQGNEHYTLYNELNKMQIKNIVNDVNMLSEKVSKLTVMIIR